MIFILICDEMAGTETKAETKARKGSFQVTNDHTMTTIVRIVLSYCAVILLAPKPKGMC